MSEPFVYYPHMDDESDLSSLSFTGPESRGHRALERTGYFQPTYQAPCTASVVSHGLRQGILPPNNWSVGAPIQAYRAATASQLSPSPFPLSSTRCPAEIPSYDSGNSPPHFAYIAGSGPNSLISQHDPRAVTMPTLIGHAQCGGGLIDAHGCHNEASFAFNDSYMAEYYRTIPPPSISMPMVPTIFGAGVSSHTDPVCPSGPGLRRPFRHCTSAFQDFPPSNSSAGLTPSGSLGSESYSSPSPPFSVGSHSPIVSPPETPLHQIQRHPDNTAFSNQLYTLTVPLEDVELPPINNVAEIHFFRCRWRNCKFWITSDNEAIKSHLSRTHNIVLKKVNESAGCEWVGCSSSPQQNGLVRHFQTHLGLTWLCSVCQGAYTRPDSVACHVRRESRCEFAHAIRYPSPVAYRITKINWDRIVTLTKILQP